MIVESHSQVVEYHYGEWETNRVAWSKQHNRRYSCSPVNKQRFDALGMRLNNQLSFSRVTNPVVLLSIDMACILVNILQDFGLKSCGTGW